MSSFINGNVYYKRFLVAAFGGERSMKKGKSKALPYQVMRAQGECMECWASVLSLTSGTTRTAESSALDAGRTLASRKFRLEAECIPGLLNTDRRNTSLDDFQGTCQESNPEPTGLWRSVLTNCDRSPHEKERRLKSRVKGKLHFLLRTLSRHKSEWSCISIHSYLRC